MTDKDKVTNVYEVRAFPNGVDRYEYFMKHSFMSLGWQELGDVSNLDETQVRNKIRENHPDYPEVKTSQIAGFFKRLKNMKKGDILLTPYIKPEGPIITIAVVTEKYHYDANLSGENMAQQIGIKRVGDLNREKLAEDFPTLHNSLKARLSITKIKREKNEAAIKSIEEIIKHNVYAGDEDSDNREEDYINNIKNIEMIIMKSKDNLTIKSVLLAALVSNETYFISRIKEKVYSAISKEDDVFSEIVKKQIIGRLKEASIRIFIAYKYFNFTSQCQHNFKNYTKLRNSLAHDIMSVKLEKNNEVSFIEIQKNEPKKIQVNIKTMLDDLLDFPQSMTEKYPE